MDNQLRIAFYSCMIGSSNNPRCLFPELPSRDFPCFMYSNNSEYLSQLKQKSSKWNCILVNHGNPIDDHVQCAYSAKYYKACPYALTELKDFQYTCYFDTTLIVDEQKVLRYVREILPYSNYKWITTNHPFLLPCVWNEYREAMLQERYSRDSSRYREYIEEKIRSGYKDTQRIHYATGFHIRENCEEVREICEEWYQEIQKCGIECQISFFFISQKWNGTISPYY